MPPSRTECAAIYMVALLRVQPLRGRAGPAALALALLVSQARAGFITNSATSEANSILSGKSGQNMACDNAAWKAVDGILVRLSTPAAAHSFRASPLVGAAAAAAVI